MEESLRQRFNPDGSILRQQQIRMLEILKTFDAICKKHQIPYWLSSGTLIGAARHKGFIPWDDDLDVEMMRKDYLRLIKILPNELPEQYKLQTHETDPGYIFIYGKLRDENSYIAETTDYDRIFNYRGIYIDIFPIEKVPYWLAWIAGHMQGRIYVELKKKRINEKAVLKRVNQIYSFNTKFGFPFLRMLTKMFPGSPVRHSFGTTYFAPRNLKDIFPLTEIEFEGQLFPAPGNTAVYLSKIYGDYMKLPDLSKVTPHLKEIRFTK